MTQRYGFPPSVFTGNPDDPDGVARIEVDQASTAFYDKREFRTFREWATPATETVVIKIITPVDVILTEMMFQHEEGSFRIETLLGGTEGGSFAEVLPTRAVNTMTEGPPVIASQVVLRMGGTLTGGTVIDISRGKVSANTQFSSTVGNEGSSMRGVAPFTYYWRITFTGFVGVLKARWEERSPV